MNEIIFAGVGAVAAVLFTRRTPVGLLRVGCVHARAVWLLACAMAEGAWSRRDRWNECVEEAWRSR